MSKDDDEGFPPEGGCIGSGSVHDLSTGRKRGVKRHPIGFVHFPEKPAKRKRPVKAKRRKR